MVPKQDVKLAALSRPGLGDSAAFDEYSNESEQDFMDMIRLGNKQEFKRNFHSLSVLGLTCVLLSTWLSILTSSTFSLINGGRAGTIWTFLGTWVCTLPVVASLGEMASMAPSAGGQYHWISEFAPSRIQKPLSYISGWLAALGWQTFVAGTAYYTAATLLSLIAVTNPSYKPLAWHNTVLAIAIGVLALLFNVFGAKRVPSFEGVVLFLYGLGFLGVIVPLWVFPRGATARQVFTDFSNYGEWSSLGAAAIIGQTATASALIGVDSAAHMAEEVKHAAKSVPRMMMLTIVVNGILGFVTVITYVFAIKDVERQILGSSSPYPYIAVFAEATGSTAAAAAMTSPIIVLNACACINSVMAASRQLWAFGRDDGLPFSAWFTRLHVVGATPLPIRAMLASLCILIVIALLNLGSSAVVNSLVGLLSSGVGITYSISIGCVLWRRLFGAPLPPAKWSLGSFGAPINAFAFFYQTFSVVIGFFPATSVVSATKMNWSIAVFGGVVIVACIAYIFHGRRSYRGPVVRIVKD